MILKDLYIKVIVSVKVIASVKVVTKNIAMSYNAAMLDEEWSQTEINDYCTLIINAEDDDCVTICLNKDSHKCSHAHTNDIIIPWMMQHFYDSKKNIIVIHRDYIKHLYNDERPLGNPIAIPHYSARIKQSRAN